MVVSLDLLVCGLFWCIIVCLGCFVSVLVIDLLAYVFCGFDFGLGLTLRLTYICWWFASCSVCVCVI